MIPASERFSFQPKELVAVLGEHRGRHGGLIRQIRISSDGSLVATSGPDRTTRLWDAGLLLMKGEIVRGNDHNSTDIAFLPDGKTLLTAGDSAVEFWDVSVSPPRIVRSIQGGATSLALSADGSRLAAGDRGKIVRLWDLCAGEPVERPPVLLSGGEPVSECLSADGRSLIVLDNQHRVEIIDLTDRAPKLRLTVPGEHQPLGGRTLSADGKTAVTFADWRLHFWDVSGNKAREINSVQSPIGWINAAEFDASGAKLLCSAGGGLMLCDVPDAQVTIT